MGSIKPDLMSLALRRESEAVTVTESTETSLPQVLYWAGDVS